MGGCYPAFDPHFFPPSVIYLAVLLIVVLSVIGVFALLFTSGPNVAQARYFGVLSLVLAVVIGGVLLMVRKR